MAQHDPRRWAPDSSADSCLGCSATFSVITRRHHCRSCGELFCESCCKHQAVLPVGPGAEQQGRVRVCANCARVSETATASADKALGGNQHHISGPTSDLVRLACYWQTLNSDVCEHKIRRQRALTKATLLLSHDVPMLKDEIVSLMKVDDPNLKSACPVSLASPSDEAPPTPTAQGSGPDAGRRIARSPTGLGSKLPVDDASLAGETSGPGGAAFLARTSPAEAMHHFFGAPSTSRLGRLEERVERLTKKAVHILKILERHSLTNFFLHMYQHLCELLMTSFVAQVACSSGLDGKRNPTGSPTSLVEAQHAKSFRRLTLHGAQVQLAASAVLARTVLHLESLRMPSSQLGSSTPLVHTLVGCELLEDIAEQIAASLTTRYQEQIVSLTTDAATTLATTAAARIHHRVHGHACASEEDFSVLLHHVALEDYIYDAILNERPAGVPEQPLQTRLRNIDAQWSDHGVLSCCGLATPEGLFYDPVYLASASETNAKLQPSVHGTQAATTLSQQLSSAVAPSSVAAKYYYRQGTIAEAVAMKMTPTGRTRHCPSPLWSAQMLYEQYQSLCRQRDGLLASYSSVPFADPSSSSWASLLGTDGSSSALPPATGGGVTGAAAAQRSGARTTARQSAASATSLFHQQQESVQLRVERLRQTLRKCRDFVANTTSLRSILTKRYQTIFHELEQVQAAMIELQKRAEDIVGTPRASAESKGLLAAIDRISLMHRTDYAPQVQQAAFHRYHKFLNVGSVSPAAATVFYLHLRTKLLMVLLGASRAELQDDPVTILGNPVPYSARVALAVDAMNAQASQSKLMRSWALSDIVDRHVERMARVLADRFRDVVEVLTPASVVVLAECCAARVLYLFSHSEDDVEATLAVSRSSTLQLPVGSKHTTSSSSSSKGTASSAGGGLRTGRTKFDWLLEVSVVQHMEHVELQDTIVGVKKIYLATLDARGSTLSEQGIHLKAGLCAADGSWWAGTRETHGACVMHHRGPKYGVLHAFPGEIESKRLLRAAPDWSVDIAPALNKKPRRSFFRSHPPPPTIVPPLLKPPPTDADNVLHLGSSTLSVGPRLVGPSEVVGVTLFPRSKRGDVVPLTPDERSNIDFIALTGSDDGRALSAVAAPPPAHIQPDSAAAASEGSPASQSHQQPSAVVQSFQCTCAGVLIIAAEYKGALLIGNAVRVRPGRVDWPQHCSVVLHPSGTVVAGATVTAVLTLRDEYSNVTSTTNPDDFSVVIDNNGESVVASSIVEEVEGTFKFVFVPTNEGPVLISITAAGVTMATTTAPSSKHTAAPTEADRSASSRAAAGIPALRCVAGLPDFKNSMFSFEEWDVVAGTNVHGNLLLRDVYGNKVEAEDEHPLVEMVNGRTTTLAVERVNRGEYIFNFTPTRQGTAVLRATSLRSFASLIARVNVVAAPAATNMDWTHSSISCLSKILFAGEVAEFHIVMRDSFGNSIASDVLPEELQCWLRYVDGEEAMNANKATLTTSFATGGDMRVEQREDGSSTTTVVRATHVTGSGASFAFRVTPGAVGDVMACASFRGTVLESCIMNVRSAPLSWPSSRVNIKPTALVGEWVPVIVDCRDRFGNPSDAQEGDFSVIAYHDPSSNPSEATTTTATVKTKPVSGAGSSFAFQVMSTKSGVLRVEVTYAGYLKHECSVTLAPLQAVWSTTELFVGAVAAPAEVAVPVVEAATAAASEQQDEEASPIAAVPSVPYLNVHASNTSIVAGSLLKIGLRFRDQYGNWTTKPTACHDNEPGDLPFHVSLLNEGVSVPMGNLRDEATRDAECSWCCWIYHVRPTTAGRVNIRAHWSHHSSGTSGDDQRKDRVREDDHETKNGRATVMPSVVDWDHCTVSPIVNRSGGSAAPTSPELCATAGSTIAIIVRLFDRFDNAVEAIPNIIAVSAVNRTTDYRDQTMELMCDVRTAGSRNELLVQCVPELSGSVTITASLADSTSNPARVPTVLVYTVVPAALDWLGRTHTRFVPMVADAGRARIDLIDDGETSPTAVAGTPFVIELHLRDGMNNPVFVDDWEDGVNFGGGSSAACPFTLILVEAVNSTTRCHPHSTAWPPESASSVGSPMCTGLEVPEGCVLGALEGSTCSSTDPASKASVPQPCEVHIPWAVHTKERGLLVATLTARIAGSATLRVACEGTERPTTSVAIIPGPASWRDSELVWDASSMTVGLAATCTIRWRDHLGNLTCAQTPPLPQLSAALHQFASPLRPMDDAHVPLVPASIVPQGETITQLQILSSSTSTGHSPTRSTDQGQLASSAVHYVSAVTHIAGTAFVRLLWNAAEGAPPGGHDDFPPMDSERIHTHAAVVAWAQSALVLTPNCLDASSSDHTNTTAAAAQADTSRRPAGTQFVYLLILRDRFGNDSVRNVTDVQRDVRAQVLFAGASIGSKAVTVRAATQPRYPAALDASSVSSTTTTGVGASHFTIAFTPTRTGVYQVGVGLSSESEVDDLMAQPTVGPAEVCWTEHTRLFCDAESVEAGAELFVQLACRDRFGNQSSVGVDVSRLAFRCALTPPWVESRQRAVAVETILGSSPATSSNDHDRTTGVTPSGSIMALPQEVGLFGVSVVVRRTGLLRISAFCENNNNTGGPQTDDDDLPSIDCDEVITVHPTVAVWEHARLLVLPRQHPSAPRVAGHALTFGLVLFDSFGNLVSPLVCEPLPPPPPPVAGRETLMTLPDAGPASGGASPAAAPPNSDGSVTAHSCADDLGTGRDRGSSTAVVSTHSGRRIVEFEELHMPLVRIVCENDNYTDHTAPSFSVIAAHPEEHTHRSLQPTIDVRPEHVPVSLEEHNEQHACVFFTVEPTIVGSCQLRLVHQDSEVVLSASVNDIIAGPVASGQLLDPVPTGVRAGEHALYQLKLRDRFHNWVLASQDARALPLERQLQLRTDTNGEDASAKRGLLWSIEAVAQHSIALRVTPTTAETLSLRLALAEDPSRAFLCALPPLVVTTAPLHAARCVLRAYGSFRQLRDGVQSSPSSGSAAEAGEPMFATLQAVDRFGNVITDVLAELSLACGGSETRQPISTLHAVNGTSTPPITLWTDPAAAAVEGAMTSLTIFTLTPVERGSSTVVLTSSGDSEQLSTDAMPVLAAPLHWPDCTVRLSDEAIVLGSSTNIIIQFRDRFLNPVEGTSDSLRVIVHNNGTRYVIQHASAPDSTTDEDGLPHLPDCDGFVTRKGKTLLCEVKPCQRGELICEVLYCPPNSDGSTSGTSVEPSKRTSVSNVI